jgi:steroid delta-isomerase-like uncharacterized protein
MSAEETVREFIRAYNAGDRAGFRAVVTDDFAYREYCTAREVRGGDEAVDVCLAWRVALPDLTGSVERLSSTADGFVWETVWRGHQTGPLTLPDGGTVPPSGVQTEVPACQVITVRDGKVSEINHYFDALGFMTAIGAIPAPAAA